MISSELPVYLASKSPRRKFLLKLLNLKFQTFHVDLHEEILDGEHPIQTVKRLAGHKLKAAEKIKSDGILITADTIVVLDHKIIGKPKNKKDAVRILSELSGRKHFVYTGFAIKNCITNKEIISYEKTAVTFRELSKSEIREYVDSGSPMDKAGAYGIQDDFGAVFVERIIGCYYNVVGLPLQKLYKFLKEML